MPVHGRRGQVHGRARRGEDATAAADAASHDAAAVLLLAALRGVGQALRRVESAAARQGVTAGVPRSQQAVLSALHGARAQSLCGLADLLHRDPSTVSVTVQDLFARGWINRAVEPRDSRRHRISLTAAGRAAARQVPRRTQDVLGQSMARSSPANVRALAGQLEALAAAMLSTLRARSPSASL
jgi:DNA-binding MarR family transcriptional regulator